MRLVSGKSVSALPIALAPPVACVGSARSGAGHLLTIRARIYRTASFSELRVFTCSSPRRITSSSHVGTSVYPFVVRNNCVRSLHYKT